MKHLVTLFVALAAIPTLGAQTAQEIVQRSRDRVNAQTTSTRSQMIITAKDGSTTERLVDQYSAKKDGLDRAVIVFQRPANVAGTRFLIVENAGREEDRWIFLPSLGKTRRIAATEGGGSFVGTDFSYDDISSQGRDLSKDTHRILREEPFGGAACWVIESVSTDASFQYSRTVLWIDKSTAMIRRAEMYDRQNRLLKTLENGDVKDMQGIATPMSATMTNVQAKTSTRVAIQIIRYDDVIPEGVFTTRYLETGRP
jgi:outer membrane lipoprotein-sorting protein